METNIWIRFQQMETITILLLRRQEMESIAQGQLPVKEMEILSLLAYKILLLYHKIISRQLDDNMLIQDHNLQTSPIISTTK